MDIQPQTLSKVLVIGESCLDIFIRGNVDRLCPEAPVPVMLQTRTETRPGMAANVALNINSLGHTAVQVTSDTQIVKERFLDERFSQQILRVDSNDRCGSLDPREVDNVLKRNKQFDATIISDYDKGFLPQNILSKIISRVPKPVFVDSKKKDLSVFEGCVIKINRDERDLAINFPFDCELITTLGDLGASWKEKIYPALNSHDIFDACGAGDSFLAALTVRFIETKDMIESIKFANTCAGISVRHLGVYNVSVSDIEKSGNI